MAGDAVKLLDALKIEKAHILGHSMGGYIAQELAVNYPQRVDKLILESTSYISSDRNNKLFAGFLEELEKGCDFEKWIRTWTSWLFSPNTLKNTEFMSSFIKSAVGYPLRQTAEGFGGQVAAIASFDSREKAGLIKAKTLVIEGEDDTLILPKEAEALAKSIKKSKFSLLKDTGHAMHIENPGPFIQEVLNFLRMKA
jgi:pimeloyl-ACP methyl ester carboxylesterase